MIRYNDGSFNGRCVRCGTSRMFFSWPEFRKSDWIEWGPYEVCPECQNEVKGNIAKLEEELNGC